MHDVTPRADLVHIVESLALVLEPGSVAELRVPNTHQRTVSGCFDSEHRGQMAEAAARWSGKAPGVYAILNPIMPDLLARAANRYVPYAKHTTGDAEILRRRWLPIDLDPKRPAGISSTEEEHDAAFRRSGVVRDFLRSLGFPDASLLLADSGNGGHILVRIDLPNDAQSSHLLQDCLRTLDLHFSDSTVAIDQTTFNAARVWKIYGTLAAKGDDTVERPHRLAYLEAIPSLVTVAPADALKRLASMARNAPVWKSGNKPVGNVDLAAWVEEHLGGLVVAQGPWGDGGWKWVLNPCPWNEEHTNRSAYIVRLSTGAIAAGCHHNGCAGKDWAAIRTLFEPGWRGYGSNSGMEGQQVRWRRGRPVLPEMEVGDEA